ncbi:MAG: type IV pilus assembly protein PilM [Candidatus Eisenbacteria bacterium]|nr:type IV pilus assembly protein PilM [Candidatus Eisenbacteria bacterium]
MRAGIGSRPWAGLDVGSFSVKLLATQGGMGASRFRCAEALLPPRTDGDDSPRPPEEVAAAIGECISQLDLSPRSFRGFTVGISGSDVIVKQISLPLMDDSEVGPALRFEARKHLPFDPQAMVIDYQVLGRYLSDRKVDVLLAAVSREHLERHLAPLAMLDASVDIVDAAPLALTNAVAQGAGLDRTGALLLDIGHAASHLTLHQRGEPYFSRRLDFGGRDLTRAIARGIQVPFEEAEEWKLAAGSEQSGLRVDWDGREMRAVLRCLQEQLVEELRRSLAFYSTLGRLPDTLRLQVSGGTARLPGIAERLGEMLGFVVTVFDPLDAVVGGAHAHGRPAGPQFAQAFGLALRTA